MKMQFSRNPPKHLRKRLSMFLLYILVAYVLLLVVTRLLEHRVIFFPDYPGRLEGDWHPRTLAPEAAYQYLVSTKGLDPKSILSFGQSLGTAVAAHLAAHRVVGGLILEAPFPSASRVASKIFWFLPGLTLLVHSQFDTQSELKQITAPILVVHCTQDSVLPFQFGLEVYDAARSPKHFLRINGDCHEESSLIAPAQYRS